MRYVARILAADASLAGPPYDRRPPSSYSRRRRISSLARKFTFPIYPANPSSPSSPSSIPTFAKNFNFALFSIIKERIHFIVRKFFYDNKIYPS